MSYACLVYVAHQNAYEVFQNIWLEKGSTKIADEMDSTWWMVAVTIEYLTTFHIPLVVGMGEEKRKTQ